MLDVVFYSLSIKAPTGLLLFKDLRLQVIVSIYQSTWGADLESLLCMCLGLRQQAERNHKQVFRKENSR